MLSTKTKVRLATHVAKGLARRPRRRMPTLVTGIVIGASAVYFLDPKTGAERRRALQRLVTWRRFDDAEDNQQRQAPRPRPSASGHA
jgi:hypothetical protein